MDNISQERVRLSVAGGAVARTLTRAVNALLSLRESSRLIRQEDCLIQ